MSDASLIACLDVDYRADGSALAACVLFADWTDDRPAAETVVRIDSVEPYEPGRFYKRELPCLTAALRAAPQRPGMVVIDGYVWLDVAARPGLGAHLHEALGGAVPVIGVAKTRFAGADAAREVFRGGARHPLFVTAAGMDPDDAARHVRSMHGPYRIPTLLKRVDQLCRGRAVPSGAKPPV